mmetsp:Transcript_2678/g.5694  ORF Transcript_2678/g.5694 Transcript_2678/m.5694 type:complete len:210 (-) Transcript_2678:118-747(-)
MIFLAAAGAALDDFLAGEFAGFLPISLAGAGALLSGLLRASTSFVLTTVLFAVTFSALTAADGASVFFGASAFFGTMVLDLSVGVFFVAALLALPADLIGEGEVSFFFEITFLVLSTGRGAFGCSSATLTRFEGPGFEFGSSFNFRFLSGVVAASFTVFFASSFTSRFVCCDLRKIALCSVISLLGVERSRALFSNFLATITRFGLRTK